MNTYIKTVILLLLASFVGVGAVQASILERINVATHRVATQDGYGTVVVRDSYTISSRAHVRVRSGLDYQRPSRTTEVRRDRVIQSSPRTEARIDRRRSDRSSVYTHTETIHRRTTTVTPPSNRQRSSWGDRGPRTRTVRITE